MQGGWAWKRSSESTWARRVAAALAVLTLAATNAGQDRTSLPGLVNGDMESVDAEGRLVGWRVPGTLLEAGYEIGPEREDVHAGAGAARLDARAVEPSPNSFGNLLQSLDAQPWQGKRVRYRAAVKVPEAESGGQAQLWLRVDLPSKGGTPQMGFFDNMGDRPITSEDWQTYEIVGDVAADAERIVLGVMALGQCLVLVDQASLEEVEKEVPATRTPQTDGASTQQPFWTPWLWLPAIGLALFALGFLANGRLALFALRFTCAYWVLYTLPDMVGFLVPWYGNTWKLWLETGPMDSLVRWGARACFGLEHELVSPFNNGSGDTTHAFVLAGLTFAAAGAVAVLWSLVDRRVRVPDRLRDHLRSWVRYYLAGFLVVYGTIKLEPLFNQMPLPFTGRLEQPYGQSSPMGLLWTFMGSSRPFTYIAGGAELLGGFLLLWRRTTLLGALVSLVVMLNVMAMNFCYDVPVKLFSSHLVLATIVVALPEARRLVQLFFGIGDGRPSALVHPFTGRAGTWVHRLAKTWFVIAVFVLPTYALVKSARSTAVVRPLIGEWKLDALAINDEEVPPEGSEVTALTLTQWQMTQEGDGWRIAGNATTAEGAGLAPSVLCTSDKLVFDTNATSESLLVPGEYTWRVEGPKLLLEGPSRLFEGSEIRATFHRADHDYLLVNRGFRWINERPFNR